MNKSKYISPKKAMLVLLTLGGLFFANEVQHSKRIADLIDCFESYKESYIDMQINKYENPLAIARDMDGDGRSDLVMKLNSGEDFVLYNTKNGYVSEFHKNLIRKQDDKE